MKVHGDARLKPAAINHSPSHLYIYIIHRQTHTTNATTAPRALSLSSEDSDGGDDSGYERDHDLTPNMPKWKRRRRQRIHTLLKPYAKKKPFGAGSGNGSARALASLSSSRENYPGLANADVGGVGKEPQAAPDERRQRMAQVSGSRGGVCQCGLLVTYWVDRLFGNMST